MIRIIGFIVFVALAAFGISWLVDRPGDVSVVWQGYRIETSVVVALVAVIAAALALALIWAVVRFVLGLPSAISFSSRARRRAKGMMSVSRGLIAVGTGDSVAARRQADEAERLLGREPLALLLKAQAAQMAGDRKGAENAFHLMLDTPETRVLGLRGLFVEARRKGDAVAARSYAQKASELAPKVGWASEAVLEYQSADRDWRGALATLERQRRQKTISRDTAKRLQAVLLTAGALERQEEDPEGALQEVREAVKLAPSLVPAAVLAGRLLSSEGSLRKAAKILESAWKIAPHPDIAEAYVNLRPGDSAHDRFLRAEALVRLAPHHPESHLIKAAAALEAQDFSTARASLAPLLEGYPTVRSCLLMADIAEAENGTGGEWREWTGRASRARRDPIWIADGVVSETWQPVSPVTGHLDAFTWMAPIEQIGGRVIEAGESGDEKSASSLSITAGTSVPIIDNNEPVTPESEVTPEASDLAPAPAKTKPEMAVQAAPIAPLTSQRIEVKDVVFPLGHAPDDPGPDAPQGFVDEPMRQNPARRAL